jgi:peptide/nickel transport system permease protein
MKGLTKAYVLKRLGMFVLTVWLGATVIFIIPRLAPGDPVQGMIGQMAITGAHVENAEELIASWRQRFGLDQPILVQYFRYLGNTFTFNSGYSLSSFPARVDDMIMRSLPWTFGLLSLATLISFVLGNLIGALLAWRDTPRALRTLLPISMVFTAIPAFMLGILLVSVFSYWLDWLPYAGGFDRGLHPAWDWAFISSVAKHAVLPALAVVLVTMGSWALGMRGMMITTDGEDYMILAKAKGLSSWRIFWAYGVRNAVLPQVTALGIALGSIVGGFVVVELIFAYPGIGYLLYDAILSSDYTLIQGIVYYVILGVALAILLLDLTYPLIDPRITYKKG